jgi:hypothetical protein
VNDRRRYLDYPRHFSKPEALDLDHPLFREARNKACTAVLAALEEFERVTGRTVSGVHLHHLDVTTLEAKQPVHMREVFVLWHETAAEYQQRYLDET